MLSPLRVCMATWRLPQESNTPLLCMILLTGEGENILIERGVGNGGAVPVV